MVESDQVQAQWFRAWVERILQDLWGHEHVSTDADGDYPFRSDTAACYVSVEDDPSLAVCVWGVAAHGLKPTLRVLREVNELNSQMRLGKVYLVGGQVRVECRLPADVVTASLLDRACAAVGSVAGDIGAMFAVVHGGATPFAAESQAS